MLHLKVECGPFLFDTTYDNFYYRVIEGNTFCFKRIRLDSPQDNNIYLRPCVQLDALKNETAFVNYYNDQFESWNNKGESVFAEAGGLLESGFYFYTDSTPKLVFKTKLGYLAFKGAHYSFKSSRDNAGFFPNNKFYYTECSAKNLQGTIFVDTETLEYDFKEFDFACFYSITNMDFKDFTLNNGIEPNLEFESSITRKIEGLK